MRAKNINAAYWSGPSLFTDFAFDFGSTSVEAVSWDAARDVSEIGVG